MPKVRVYEQQVQERGLATPMDKPVESGLGDLGQGLGRAGDALERLGRKQKQEFDHARIQDAYVKVSQWQNDFIYHPEKGAKAVRGEKAIGLGDRVIGDFDKFAKELSDTLDDDQKEQFSGILQRERETTYRELGRHEFGEVERIKGEKYEAAVNVSIGKAANLYKSPDALKLEQGMGEGAIIIRGEQRGWGGEQVQAELAGFREKFHESVAKQYVLTGDDVGAQKYLDGVKDQLGTQAGKVQEQVYGLSKKIRDEKDAQLLGRVFQQIHHAGGNLNEKSADYAALSDVSKGKALDKALAVKRSRSQRGSAANREQKELDDIAFWNFGALALEDQAVIDIETEFPSASDPMRARLGALQKRSKLDLDKLARPQRSEFQDEIEANARGLDKKAKQAFEGHLMEWRAQRLQENNGKPPTREEVDKAIARAHEKVTLKNRVLPDNVLPAQKERYLLTPDEEKRVVAPAEGMVVPASGTAPATAPAQKPAAKPDKLTRARELKKQGKTSKEIAEILTAEGL